MLSEFQKPNNILHLEQIRPYLVTRSKLICAIRSWFEKHSFLETMTPLLIDAPAPEEYIEAPQSGNLFLRTSPELQMKKLVVAGYEKIYQIGPCFREGEVGQFHRPEFTMLEWYETGIDYSELMRFTYALLKELATVINNSQPLTHNKHTVELNNGFEIITVHDAFKRFTSTTANQALKDDTFDELMVYEIEPNLGVKKPTFLTDYPAECAALSKLKEGSPDVAERWELYLAGIEIANAYSELTDPVVQRERFAHAQQKRKETGYRDYPEATTFLNALDYGMPECAGCALGIDRLIMFFSGAQHIESVTLPT